MPRAYIERTVMLHLPPAPVAGEELIPIAGGVQLFLASYKASTRRLLSKTPPPPFSRNRFATEGRGGPNKGVRRTPRLARVQVQDWHVIMDLEEGRPTWPGREATREQGSKARK